LAYLSLYENKLTGFCGTHATMHFLPSNLEVFYLFCLKAEFLLHWEIVPNWQIFIFMEMNSGVSMKTTTLVFFIFSKPLSSLPPSLADTEGGRVSLQKLLPMCKIEI
jgi:hypothetical protein